MVGLVEEVEDMDYVVVDKVVVYTIFIKLKLEPLIVSQPRQSVT